jgi:hypothetical protein
MFMTVIFIFDSLNTGTEFIPYFMSAKIQYGSFECSTALDWDKVLPVFRFLRIFQEDF